MSRIGKLPINIPSGVTVVIDHDNISVTGPKGSVAQFTMPGITVAQKEDYLLISRFDDDPITRSRHGLMRALLANMIKGVSEGFSKKLEVNGVGYRVNLSGNTIKLNLGFSHDVVYSLPEDVSAIVDQNVITISGVSKQKVGQVSAEIRALKKPEPYKGKGIKYVGERIIRKSGKSGKE